MERSSKEIREQINQLEAEFQQARIREKVAARAQIQAILREFDLTPEDLGRLPRSPDAMPPKTPLEPVFRNELGETWSGRGRMPRWLEGKDKEQYRINKDQPEQRAQQSADH